MRPALVVFLVALVAMTSSAQTEATVNVAADSSQRAPAIVRADNGDMTVVWHSHTSTDPNRPRIMMRWLTPAGVPDGSEAIVAGSIRPAASFRFRQQGAQEKPVAAISPTGLLVIAWVEFDSTSWYDIKMRLFRKSGVVSSVITVNTTLPKTQSDPSVDIRSDGRIVVAWDSWDQDGSQRGVYARLFDSTGAALTGELQVNTVTAGGQSRPVVRFGRDSSFIVAWEEWRSEGSYWKSGDAWSVANASGYGVVARSMTPNGQGTAPFLMNTTVADYQWMSDLTVFPDGKFFVVWCSWEQDGDDGAIIGRWARSSGPIGPEILINSSTRYYQWLPRVKRRGNRDLAVIWSSWQTDGDREGIYAALLDSSGFKRSLETRMNVRTQGFQWEPDAVMLGDRDMVAVWSDWVGGGNDYDVKVRRLTLEVPTGRISGTTVAGKTTSRFTVHVTDSSALTGHLYQASVTSVSGDTAMLKVQDVTDGRVVVPSYSLDRGRGLFYATPVFDGLRLQVEPEFTLSLDVARSTTVTRIATTMPFVLGAPSVGTQKLAPIDVAVIWGQRDTASNGRYVTPLDTAINVSGQAVVQLPFRAWNLTDRSKVEVLVVDANANGRWDAGERIELRTPVPYRSTATNTHAELAPITGPGLTLPAPGDTIFVLTVRPLTTDDAYRFTASRSLVVGVSPTTPSRWALAANYPNPFNPTTSIRFETADESRVSVAIYDLLGRQVVTLLDEVRPAGVHTVRWDARNVSSGAYLCVLRAGDRLLVRRMTLVK